MSCPDQILRVLVAQINDLTKTVPDLADRLRRRSDRSQNSPLVNDVYMRISLIMLIGLVAKNGILIVEFANQRQINGEDKLTAIKEASAQRLRPILMTSASTILGLLPLMFATGEGCNSRIAMGTAVVGGMIVSTLLTMYVVPAVYTYISTNLSTKKKK